MQNAPYRDRMVASFQRRCYNPAPMSDLQKIFDDLKKSFKPGTVTEKTTFYFSLGDEADEKWTMTISPKECQIVPGKIENADCVLKTSSDLFIKIMKGQYKPGMGDLMSGKIKSNDPQMLQTLLEAFGLEF